MNQNFVLSRAIIIFLIVCISCNNNGKTQQNEDIGHNEAVYDLPDLAGKYILPSAGCDLTLSITKEKNDFKYAFKGMGGIIDMSGNLLFSKEGDSYRLIFDGPIENNAPKTVEAIFKDKGITIQNYGTADQNFTVFSDCQEKYLEFKRI
jgi:hypothetical protein